MNQNSIDLNRNRDPVELIRALGRLTNEQQDEFRKAVFELCRHSDADVREEALRVLAVKWRDWSSHPIALKTLRSDPSNQVRATGAYGVAATSRPETREEDVRALLDVVLDEEVEPDLRGAAYDALLILHRRASFPAKTRQFEPETDVEWEWIRQIDAELREKMP